MAEELPQDPQRQETQQPQSGTQINPEVLSALGLTPQDLEEYDEERLKEAKTLEDMQNKGAEYYQRLKTSQPSTYVQGVNLGDLGTMTPNTRIVSEIPDDLFIQVEELDHKYHYSPENRAKMEARLRALCRGYGTAAIQKQDYDTAINAFDLATEGGILKNEIVMAGLRSKAQEDKTTGIKIAQAIQAREDRRPLPPTPEPAPVNPGAEPSPPPTNTNPSG